MSATVTTSRTVPAPRPSGIEARARREAWTRRLPLLPAIVLMIIVTQIPFLLTLFYSLFSWNLAKPGSPHWVGLQNYSSVFTDPVFFSALLHTIEITFGSVIIATVLGLGLAMLLDRKFFGRGVVRTLLISPFLIMPTAAALLWKTTMLDPVFGIVNWVIGWFGFAPVAFVSSHPLGSVIATVVWQWTPFEMLILLAGLQSQPRDVLEAARVDGASPLATFREITLPHLRSYLELGVLLGAIYLVNTFDAIYMITQGGPGTSTTNLPFYIYQRAFEGFDIGQAAALGVVTVVGTIIVATVALRTLFSIFIEDNTARA
ncbi:MAG TPA: sugar ABC transporter permease [Solirubrobacteraceae bacterium]|jgi:sorbitol/mannitol transport system permease protein|nr:sugar ABC transporter permease [Solirubrobacteraceae bacterium]